MIAFNLLSPPLDRHGSACSYHLFHQPAATSGPNEPNHDDGGAYHDNGGFGVSRHPSNAKKS
ncbi:MAG: hypothetical protein QOH05_2285 [Acetobacteraceae bacterium]|jgi:hypothetical protein|nr:hypothetical protein [Acetobacteraceae bacterium]